MSAAFRNCRYGSSRERSASATAPPAATSPTARRCSTRWPNPDSSAWAPNYEPPPTSAGDEFQPRLEATAAAYIRFATTDPALLDLMFASKHRATEPSLHDAMERAFSVMMEVIVQGQAIGRLQPGDPERVGLVLFSTIQGIAALLTAGMITPEQLDELTTDAIAHFLRGSRTAG